MLPVKFGGEGLAGDSHPQAEGQKVHNEVLAWFNYFPFLFGSIFVFKEGHFGWGVWSESLHLAFRMAETGTGLRMGLGVRRQRLFEEPRESSLSMGSTPLKSLERGSGRGFIRPEATSLRKYYNREETIFTLTPVLLEGRDA